MAPLRDVSKGAHSPRGTTLTALGSQKLLCWRGSGQLWIQEAGGQEDQCDTKISSIISSSRNSETVFAHSFQKALPAACFVFRTPTQCSTSSPGKEMKVIDWYSRVTAGAFINPVCLDPWSLHSSDSRPHQGKALKHVFPRCVFVFTLHSVLPCQ